MEVKPTLRERRAHETRQMILEAAYRLFASRGYGQTSVDAVIAEAGLSKGAFYHHFVSKEALFKALLEDRQRRCVEQMVSAVAPASSRREAIERLATVSLQFNEADPQWVRLYFEFCMQAMREEFARDIVAGSMRECREIVAEMLRSGQDSNTVRADLDADVAAFLLIGLFDGIALQAAVDPRVSDPSRLVKPAADLIERFIQ